MKRALTICILFVFTGYIIVLFSAVNAFGVRKISFLGNTLSLSRQMAGLGSLFTREVSFNNFETNYRVHQNGKWETWQQFELPAFKDYIDNGNYAALKHNRLDIHLGQELYFKGAKQYPKDLSKTQAFNSFMAHLKYRHVNSQQIDSIEISYTKKWLDSNSIKRKVQLLKYKTAT
jgi:hypothetical protein